MTKLSAEELDLAFRAVEFRREFDTLLDKHGCRLQLGWDGKWSYLQVVWPDNNTKALTLAKIQKGSRVRVLTEAEEMLKQPGKLGA